MINVYEIKNYLSTVTFKEISIWNHFISLFRKKIILNSLEHFSNK